MKRSPRPRTPTAVSASLHQQLNAYALAAGAAGVGLLALAQPTEAKIVYTPAHVRLVYDRPLPLDLDHDGTVDFDFLSFNTGSPARIGHNVWACQSLNLNGTRGPFCLSTGTNRIAITESSHGRLFAPALRKGERIRNRLFNWPRASALQGQVVQTDSSGIFWYGPWVNDGKGVKDRYLGLKFKIKGHFHYGWARMTVKTTQNNFTATLTGYAYETIPGKGIIAGQTKNSDVSTVSPASLGHLAAGASAIPAWRVKRTAATNR